MPDACTRAVSEDFISAATGTAVAYAATGESAIETVVSTAKIFSSYFFLLYLKCGLFSDILIHNIIHDMGIDENAEVQDVASQNVGYDIEVTTIDEKKRYYEVKSVNNMGEEFSITNNEIFFRLGV